MSVFVARLASRRAPLTPVEALERWLPFAPQPPEIGRAAGSEIAVWSWNAPLDRPLLSDARRALLIDGLTPVSGATIEAALAAGPVPGFAELAGSFAAVLVRDDTLIAYSNTSAGYPLYWAELGDELLVSNRAAIVAAVAGARIDPVGGAWLASLGYRPSGYATFQRVRQLAPGERLTAVRRGDAFDVRTATPPLAPLYDQAGRSGGEYRERIKDCFDQVVDDATRVPFGRRTFAQVTGGRDSRDVLAILDGAGVMGRIDEFHTIGPEYSPDVLSARDVAAAFGVTDRHRVDTGGHRSNFDSTVRAIVGTLRGTGAAISLHDRSEDGFKPDLLMISGHRAGLRRTSLSALGHEDFETFATAVSRHWLDPAHILTGDAREQLRGQRFDEMVALRERGVPVDGLAEASAWLHRGGGWGGNIIAPHRAAHQHVNLLLDNRLVALSLALPRICSDGELISFLVLQRARAENLAAIPFAKHGWSPSLAAALDLVGERALMPKPACPYRVPPPLKEMLESRPSNWAAETLVLLAPTMRALAHDHRDAISFVDVPALDRRLAAVETGTPQEPLELIALLGLATVLLSARYSTRLFDRGQQEAVVEELKAELGGEQSKVSPAVSPGVALGSECQAEIAIRDQALAGFCVADQRQRQWAEETRPQRPKPSRLRRFGARLPGPVRSVAKRTLGVRSASRLGGK